MARPPSVGETRGLATSNAGTALVTDAALRTALYVVRSLGRNGVRVTAVERETPNWRNLAALSRHVRRRLTVPDNITDPDGFGEALLGIARDHDVLVPIGMHSIEVVARNRPAFDAVTRVLLPPWDVIASADHTRRVLEVARAIGIPVPSSYEPSAYSSLEELARAARYPVFVKTGLEANLAPANRYQVARDGAELLGAITRMRSVTANPIIQERIHGRVAGFEAVYDLDGRIVAAFCHRRLRQYPLHGGPSTYCESCHIEKVEEYGRRLLDHLGWVGLAMVEFMIDDRDGEPKLMEVNPRPWGSMALPIRAGVDFPWLAYRLARGERIAPRTSFPAGVRLRFLVNDLYAALAEARIADSFGARVTILGSLLDPRVKEGVLSLRDPLPSLAYLLKGVSRVFGGSPGTM